MVYSPLPLRKSLTNQVVVVIDEQDRRLIERRLPNELAATLEVLAAA